ncbi:hypothetical protein Syun_025357 [Stephania yunnanensis]|uniref:Copine C-terminal domain-containing protein n=1 Tax=Stephania yunnanensis TaxID=152371 RepID=A0AAP0EWW3_9MAGN
MPSMMDSSQIIPKISPKSRVKIPLVRGRGGRKGGISGTASTHDQYVFSFYSDKRPCNGFEEALARYKEIVPQLRLSGPMSFAPIIEMTMLIVQKNGGQYHVLLIVADGQMTRSENAKPGRLSSQKQMTTDVIVKARDDGTEARERRVGEQVRRMGEREGANAKTTSPAFSSPVFSKMQSEQERDRRWHNRRRRGAVTERRRRGAEQWKEEELTVKFCLFYFWHTV